MKRERMDEWERERTTKEIWGERERIGWGREWDETWE